MYEVFEHSHFEPSDGSDSGELFEPGDWQETLPPGTSSLTLAALEITGQEEQSLPSAELKNGFRQLLCDQIKQGDFSRMLEEHLKQRFGQGGLEETKREIALLDRRLIAMGSPYRLGSSDLQFGDQKALAVRIYRPEAHHMAKIVVIPGPTLPNQAPTLDGR